MRMPNAESKKRFRASAAASICQGEPTAVGFRDLAAECQTDSGAFRFRREKWHEKIGRVHDAVAFINDEDFDAVPGLVAAHGDSAAGFERSVDRVMQKIDQHLLDLRRIGPEFSFSVRAEV